MNNCKPTFSHSCSVVKMAKVKERILKEGNKKQVTCKSKPICLSSNFSAATLTLL